MKRLVLSAAFALVALCCLSSDIEACGRRGVCFCDPNNCGCANCLQGCPDCGSCAGGVCVVSQPAVNTNDRQWNAILILNADRGRRGLHAYIEDPALTQAALACAKYRAEHRIAGHTGNDFVFLNGAISNTSGCACWGNDGTFGACAMHDRRYRYAGAATVIGADGKAYHQLFVR